MKYTYNEVMKNSYLFVSFIMQSRWFGKSISQMIMPIGHCVLNNRSNFMQQITKSYSLFQNIDFSILRHLPTWKMFLLFVCIFMLFFNFSLASFISLYLISFSFCTYFPTIYIFKCSYFTIIYIYIVSPSFSSSFLLFFNLHHIMSKIFNYCF